MSLSNKIVPLEPADVLARRVRLVARYYNSGAQLATIEAIDLLVHRLTEAERTLAKIAHALNGDGGASGMTELSVFEERLAGWALVFPEEDGLPWPGVAAGWATALEAALQELRETRRPISDMDRLNVIGAVQDLLDALGKVERVQGGAPDAG